MRNSKILFFIGLTVIGLLTVLYLDITDKDFEIHDIIVEFHGLIFDLIIFGLLITIYDSIKSRQDRVIRYKEEIRDFSGWESEEAKYRIRGLIKRLIDLKAKKVELYGCYIKNCPYTKKMVDWKFATAKLYNSYFIDCDLSKSTFYLSELHDSSFYKVNLTDCNFGLSVLDDCNFSDCILLNTNFDFAYVRENDWFKVLQLEENIGVEEINEKYIISSNFVTINSVNYYQIIDKVHKDRKSTRLNSSHIPLSRMPSSA